MGEQTTHCTRLLADARLPTGFCASHFADGLKSVRSLHVTAPGDVLCLDRGSDPPSIVALVGGGEDGWATRVIIAQKSGLNHGLAVHGGFVYASSDTTVWRWPYVSGQRTASAGDGTIVVNNINADGNGGAPRGHWTRTLAFDAQGRLYVSVGSVGNVDADSLRSRIRRFPPFPNSSNSSSHALVAANFAEAEVFADGLRNEVGLAFDRHGVLWGVENGADNLYRGDLGGDIHNDNPAEELNRFDESGRQTHYGYPYCWTEYGFAASRNLGGAGRGTVWAWPSFMEDGVHTDAWCRANTTAPIMAMQAHSAPLGITFYEHGAAAANNHSAACAGSVGAFPAEMDGDAFVAFHGSWNRDDPTGYKVVRIRMNASTGLPLDDQPSDFLWSAGIISVSSSGSDSGGSSTIKWPCGLRPVDVAFDPCGRLLVSSDGTRDVGGGGVFIVRYVGGAYQQTTRSEPRACQADVGGAGLSALAVAAIVAGAALALGAAVIVATRWCAVQQGGDGAAARRAASAASEKMSQKEKKEAVERSTELAGGSSGGGAGVEL